MSESSLSTSSSTSVSQWDDDGLGPPHNSVIVVDGNSSVLVDNPPDVVAKTGLRVSPVSGVPVAVTPPSPRIEMEFEKTAYWSPIFLGFWGMVFFNGWGFMVLGYRRRAFGMFAWNVIVFSICHLINMFTPVVPIGFLLYLCFCVTNFLDVRCMGNMLRRGETPDEWFSINPWWRRIMNSKYGFFLQEPWPYVPGFLNTKVGRGRQKEAKDALSLRALDQEAPVPDYEFWLVRAVRGDFYRALTFFSMGILVPAVIFFVSETLGNIIFYVFGPFVIGILDGFMVWMPFSAVAMGFLGAGYRKSADTRARVLGWLCVVEVLISLSLGQLYLFSLTHPLAQGAIGLSIYLAMMVWFIVFSANNDSNSGTS